MSNVTPQPDASVKPTIDPHLRQARNLPLDLGNGRTLILSAAYARRVGYANAGEMIEKLIASGYIVHPEANGGGGFRPAKFAKPVPSSALARIDAEHLFAWLMPDGTLVRTTDLAGQA